MKKIIIEVQEDTLDQATGVLEDLGLDVESAVRMFLKRVVKEQSVAFVLPNVNAVSVSQPVVERAAPQTTETVKVDRGEMRKSLAMITSLNLATTVWRVSTTIWMPFAFSAITLKTILCLLFLRSKQVLQKSLALIKCITMMTVCT